MQEQIDSGPSIRIKVSLMADLRKYQPREKAGPRAYVLDRSARLCDVLAAVGIPPSERVTLSVNNELAEPDTPLHDGDVVVLFSAMEGG